MVDIYDLNQDKFITKTDKKNKSDKAIEKLTKKGTSTESIPMSFRSDNLIIFDRDLTAEEKTAIETALTNL